MTAARQGFTLLELIVVLGLLSLAMAITFGSTRGIDRQVEVKAAADELAQAIRQARALAIERQAPVAISFNIQNAPGSSGAVLNNWSGGHWYQLVGSIEMAGDQSMLNGMYGLPHGTLGRLLNQRMADASNSNDTPADVAVKTITGCFIGQRRMLPKKKVRFLALTDQDNGGYRMGTDNGGNLYRDAGGVQVQWGQTYPRPWFGTWDEAAKRLYPWGGYDHALKMVNRTGGPYWFTSVRKVAGDIVSPSGFFYEGNDGPITGSLHPKDRWIVSDTVGADGIFENSNANPTIPKDPLSFNTQFFRQGDARPLINAEWMDYYLMFLPDGTMHTSVPLGLRKAFADYHCGYPAMFHWAAAPDNTPATTGLPPSGTTFPKDLTALGPGDMCNFGPAGDWGGDHYGDFARTWKTGGTYSETNANRTQIDDHLWSNEMSSYMDRTGWTWITVAPDADPNSTSNSFPDAQSAYRSIMSAYRVGVSRYGEVRVVQVSPNMPAAVQTKYRLDDTLTGTMWDNFATVVPLYATNQRTDAAGKPLGIPADDFLTLDMFRRRTWWLLNK